MNVALAFGQQVNILVDKDYFGNFTLSNNISVSLMALLNLDATIVTSVDCPNCDPKVYNISAATGPVPDP